MSVTGVDHDLCAHLPCCAVVLKTCRVFLAAPLGSVALLPHANFHRSLDAIDIGVQHVPYATHSEERAG